MAGRVAAQGLGQGQQEPGHHAEEHRLLGRELRQQSPEEVIEQVDHPRHDLLLGGGLVLRDPIGEIEEVDGRRIGHVLGRDVDEPIAQVGCEASAEEGVDEVALAVDDHQCRLGGLRNVMQDQRLEPLGLAGPGAAHHVHVLEELGLGDVEWDGGVKERLKRGVVEVRIDQGRVAELGFGQRDWPLLGRVRIHLAVGAGIAIDSVSHGPEQFEAAVASFHQRAHGPLEGLPGHQLVQGCDEERAPSNRERLEELAQQGK